MAKNMTGADNPMTDRQRRMIFKSAKAQGLDNDVLHSYVEQLVGKSSLKELSVLDAIKVIDGLAGTKQVTTPSGERMISDKQRSYIEGMAKNLGWVDESGKIDNRKLDSWLENKYKVSHINWLTSKVASDAIEGLKKMNQRKKDAQKNNLSGTAASLSKPADAQISVESII